MDELGAFQKGELIYLCDCHACKPFHHQCLKKFVRRNMTLRSHDKCLYFKVENLFCPYCGKEYPRNYKIGEKKYQLVTFERINDSPYVILERLGNMIPKKGVYEGVIARFRGHDSNTIQVVGQKMKKI